MGSLDQQRGDEEFGLPWFQVWLPLIVLIAALGLGIHVLTDSGTHRDVYLFWVFWTVSVLLGFVQSLRGLHKNMLRLCVSEEGIERLRPNPALKARWGEVAGVEATTESLTLSVAGGEIIIPRTLPRYMELYRVISEHVPRSVLHAAAGLPVVLHYRSFSVGSFAAGMVGWAAWLFMVNAFCQSWGIGSVWFWLMMAAPVLTVLQELYRWSKRYEFHADRIVLRSGLQSKEYLQAELKDGYLEESARDEATEVVLRLVFTNGDTLELRDGNMSVQQLHAVLKAQYSLV
jgi:hypothetical protein